MPEEEMCEHKNIKSSCEFCYIKKLEKENKELRHAIVDDDSITEHKEILEFAEDLTEHLKDTKRWRKYHYAPDCNEVKFTLFEYCHFPKHNYSLKTKKNRL